MKLTLSYENVLNLYVLFLQVPPMLDFLVTWLALSNSFWNPFLYWLLNNHFRRISSELISSGVIILILKTLTNPVYLLLPLLELAFIKVIHFGAN